MSAPTLLSRHKMFNGSQERYVFLSQTTLSEMVFSVYLPPQALQGYAVPALYWLPDLQQTDEIFVNQSGAQRFAAHWGMALISLNMQTLQEPNLIPYMVQELPILMEQYFPINHQRCISGQGAGGELALQLAMNHPNQYVAVSVFCPLVHANWIKPIQHKLPILIDDASMNPAYTQDGQAESLLYAARAAGLSVQYYCRSGYDSSYYFIASFIDSHIEFHADALDL